MLKLVNHFEQFFNTQVLIKKGTFFKLHAFIT